MTQSLSSSLKLSFQRIKFHSDQTPTMKIKNIWRSKSLFWLNTWASIPNNSGFTFDAILVEFVKIELPKDKISFGSNSDNEDKEHLAFQELILAKHMGLHSK